MTAYLSLNDPRFFKQYYFSTGKPFESEHLFLLYRYPEFTSHYFDILVGLCVTHNFVNFLFSSLNTLCGAPALGVPPSPQTPTQAVNS